jgi:Uma2 family endonuclease
MDFSRLKPMTREIFYAWAQADGGRYEFDGVQPVAMADITIGHSVVTGNLNCCLANHLAGKSCEYPGPCSGIATIGQTVRYPDAVVTCSKIEDRDYLVPNPVIVFEVVSAASTHIDRVIKLREYQAVPSIRRYVLVELDAGAVTLHARNHDGGPFRTMELAGTDMLKLPEIGIEIPVSAIYERRNFGQDATP